MPKIIRITTVPMALHVLLKGQMRYMKQKGFDVEMVSADGREREAVIQDEGCPHMIIPMTRKITPFKDIVSLFRLIRLFRKEKPDIVHSHTPKAGLLGMLAARIAGVKIRIHTVAGLRFMTSEGFTRKLLVRMEKLTGRFATHIWPNSVSLLSYINENNLMPDKKLEVIGKGSSNGINLKRYSPGVLVLEKLTAIKENINYSDKCIYLLCVGRIVKDKGIDELVHAFVRLYEQNDQLRLLLVGDYEDELDPVTDNSRHILKNHPAIIMTGWREDVEYFMAFSYALIHPSYREGFPNVVLQAGAMQCPVICSRIPGNVDIVEHEKTGLLFPVKSTDGLFDQMKQGLENPELLRQYSHSLRQKIEHYFDQSIVQELIYKKYIQLLAQATPAA